MPIPRPLGGVVVLLASCGLVQAQFGRIPGLGGGRGTGGMGTPPTLPGGKSRPGQGKRAPAQEPLGTFSGVVKGASAKALTILEAGEHSVRFDCNKKTQYFDGTKKIKAEALKAGDRVSVEARQLSDGRLEAAKVRIERETTAKESQ